jgi:hypothetical protein
MKIRGLYPSKINVRIRKENKMLNTEPRIKGPSRMEE